MANMAFYTYPESIKSLFKPKSGSQKITTTLEDTIKTQIGILNSSCAEFLNGFDASNSDNWLGLMSSPRSVEQVYLIDNPEGSAWQKKFKADQKRLETEYKKTVKEVQKKRLNPLAEREAIQQAVAKNKKLRQWVMNPIQDKEIPDAYNRYMEGQNIRLNETQAFKDLEALGDVVSALKTNVAIVGGRLTDVNRDMLFGGVLKTDNLLKEIQVGIANAKSGWSDLISALVAGNTSAGEALTRQQAKRVVAVWVGQLRQLRGKCQQLVGIIEIGASSLSLSDAKIGKHILSHANKGTVDMEHREVFYWALTHYTQKGMVALAESYAALGFESREWADDYIYQTNNNDGFIKNEKLKLPEWFKFTNMVYTWTASIDVRDMVLSDADPTHPQYKLFDVAISYVKTPTARTFNL